MSETEPPYTIEVNDRGRLLYPLEFHGWPTLTDQPAAAKRYTQLGARRLVARLKRELPGWSNRISLVRHPVERPCP